MNFQLSQDGESFVAHFAHFTVVLFWYVAKRVAAHEVGFAFALVDRDVFFTPRAEMPSLCIFDNVRMYVVEVKVVFVLDLFAKTAVVRVGVVTFSVRYFVDSRGPSDSFSFIIGIAEFLVSRSSSTGLETSATVGANKCPCPRVSHVRVLMSFDVCVEPLIATVHFALVGKVLGIDVLEKVGRLERVTGSLVGAGFLGNKGDVLVAVGAEVVAHQVLSHVSVNMLEVLRPSDARHLTQVTEVVHLFVTLCPMFVQGIFVLQNSQVVSFAECAVHRLVVDWDVVQRRVFQKGQVVISLIVEQNDPGRESIAVHIFVADHLSDVVCRGLHPDEFPALLKKLLFTFEVPNRFRAAEQEFGVVGHVVA